MAGSANYIGFFLAILSWIGFVFTTAFNEWKRNSIPSSEAFLSQAYFSEGLWLRCQSPVPGQVNCDNYDVAFIGVEPKLQAQRALMILATLFGFCAVCSSAISLPCTNFAERMKNNVSRVAGVFLVLAADLQGQRAMMVLATILGFIGIIAAILGLDCVAMMQGTKGKQWTGRSGGICMILAGCLCLAAVSWYAADVIFDFYRQEANVIVNNQSQIIYEFGTALYVGWVSAGIAVLAGALLLCCSCGGGDEPEEAYRYTYKPPQASKSNARSAEYV